MPFNKSESDLNIDNLQVARTQISSAAVSFLAALKLFNTKNPLVTDAELEAKKPAHVAKRQSIVDAIAELGPEEAVKTKLQALIDACKPG